MRRALTFAGGLGFYAVALGAFGAHGLKAHLETRHAADPAHALYLQGVWDTGSEYALAHALALLALAALSPHVDCRALRVATWLFLIGALIFSGTLYLRVLTDVKVFGEVTPLGGLLLLAGWIACALSARSGASQPGVSS